MTVSRLLRYPVILVSRTDSGDEDSWGSPIMDEVETNALCYFQQYETSDDDTIAEDTPTTASYTVFLEPDTDPGPYDAVKLDVGRGVEQFEIVGQPEMALNARTATGNHFKMRVRRALP